MLNDFFLWRIFSACFKKKNNSSLSKGPRRLHVYDSSEELRDATTTEGSTLHDLNAMTGVKRAPQKHMVSLDVQGVPLLFEVDSGAAYFIIIEDTYRESWPHHLPPLHPANIALRTWSGEGLQPLGTSHVRVRFKQRSKELPLLIMSGTGCNLLGRNWFDPLGISLNGIHHVLQEQSLVAILEHHSVVIDGDLNSSKVEIWASWFIAY